MLIALALLSILGLTLAGVAARRMRTKRKGRTPPDVIHLGYDDQDNVSSMRETMLNRLARGDLDQR